MIDFQVAKITSDVGFLLVREIDERFRLNYIYALNPVADHIWEMLDGQNTMQEIRDQLLAEFAASSQEVEQELREFLEQSACIGSMGEA